MPLKSSAISTVSRSAPSRISPASIISSMASVSSSPASPRVSREPDRRERPFCRLRMADWNPLRALTRSSSASKEASGSPRLPRRLEMARRTLGQIFSRSSMELWRLSSPRRISSKASPPRPAASLASSKASLSRLAALRRSFSASTAWSRMGSIWSKVQDRRAVRSLIWPMVPLVQSVTASMSPVAVSCTMRA